jgi:hypothetical protein
MTANRPQMNVTRTWLAASAPCEPDIHNRQVVSSNATKEATNFDALTAPNEPFHNLFMTSTLHELKDSYENRIRALLKRWREACRARKWRVTELEPSFEELPTGSPVYGWWFDVEISIDRKVHIGVTLESETEPNDDGGFLTVVHCFPTITLGIMGSDYVRWDAPQITDLLGDDDAFEQKFRALEEIPGARVPTAIDQHILDESTARIPS